MSTVSNIPDSLAAFYAHALGLEYECEHRLIDLSRALEAHHNLEAASIFSQAEKMRAENIQILTQLCEDLDLPRIAPWDYYWHQYSSVEGICIDFSIHYLITAFESIELVLAKLDAARGFYHAIETRSDDPEVQQAAKEMIDLLKREMKLVEGWKAHHDASASLSDFDPPNQPE